jgi:hypothetical protein
MTWKTTNTAKGDNKLYSDAKGVVPSLDLRFAEGKNLNDYMTGQNLITFSRPVGANQSPGTYVDENGIIQLSSADTPRFDHDPTTGESLGLLIEEARTNLLTNSEEFDTVWQTANTTVTPNTTASPDDNTTADKVVAKAQNGPHSIYLNIVTSAVPYTLSVWAKAAGYNYIGIEETTNGNKVTSFDLTNGTIGVVNAAHTASIAAFPNGWYRCSVTFTGSTNLAAVAYRVLDTVDRDVASWLGDGISGIYVWGAQLELGSFPTSYIPTTGTALTRSADVAEITGTNFSSWYNQSEGTVFVDRTYNLNFSGQSYYFSDSGLFGNRFRLELISHIGTNTDASFFNLPALGNKSALAVKTNDVAVSAGGSSVVSDTTFTLALMDRLFIGKHPTVTSYLNGTISRLTYFPDRLEDSVLQAITQ